MLRGAGTRVVDRRVRKRRTSGLAVFLEFAVRGVGIFFEAFVALVVARSTPASVTLLLLFLLAAQNILGKSNLPIVASGGSEFNRPKHGFEFRHFFNGFWFDHRLRRGRRSNFRRWQRQRRSNRSLDFWNSANGLGNRIRLDLNIGLRRD